MTSTAPPVPPPSAPAVAAATAATVEATVAAATPGAEPAGPHDRPYERLAMLPRSVWLPALITAAGRREVRLEHTRLWLAELQAGQLPHAAWDFGEPDATGPLRAIVGELGLPRLAHGVPTLAEQVLRTLLWHLDRLPGLRPRLARAEAIATLCAEFRAAWRVESAGIEQQLALLRELADGAHLQWDQLSGQLKSRDWAAAREAAERLATLPALNELIERLGRAAPRPAAPPRRAPEPAPVARQRLPLRAVETRISGAPGELTGIRFGARLDRMLSTEAALLSHPMGRRLWRARHAEGRLLEHDTEAVLIDWRADPAAARQAPVAATRPEPLAHGPLVLCLDTSGSMRGAPENIAKAVVIAALRAARRGRRGCRVVAFGGPGELLERDLAGPGGFAALLELMGQSFDGGTDIQTPIERAIELVHEAAWASADLVIVSDGEFGCVPATLERLDQARAELGLAVQGVLVGDRETMGMMEICDQIHWVRDWRRHVGEAEATSARLETLLARPVHSQSLTALYFPNALSPRAARHHRAGPAQAGGGLAAAPGPATAAPPLTPKKTR